MVKFKLPERRKVMSLTRKDFEVQTFRSGGPGGQHQNKRNTGVRILHRASGAVGESRTERSQYKNKCLAFERLVDSKEFQSWTRFKAADVEGKVTRGMHPKNLKIEVMEDGEWVEQTQPYRP